MQLLLHPKSLTIKIFNAYAKCSTNVIVYSAAGFQFQFQFQFHAQPVTILVVKTLFG